MRDRIVLGLLLFGFAGFVTSHVLSVLALTLSHRPRWRGLLALVVAPLAPFWLWRAGRRALPIVWAVTLVAYAVGFAAARLGG